MKKLFYTLILSVIGVTNFSIYSLDNLMNKPAIYKWACYSGKDFPWSKDLPWIKRAKTTTYESKEEAEKACSKYPNGEVMQININVSGIYKIG